MSVQVADLVANLRSSDEGFSHSMDVAGHAVEGLHHNTNSALGSVKALGLGLGALSAGALVGAVKQASDFSTMMVHVQSNTGISNAQLAVMSGSIKQLAADSGAPLDQLSEGWMRVHNSMFSAADSTIILKSAMESALSTGDDVGKVAAALGVAMHEFHIGTDQATQSMNLLHTAAQLGNSTLGEFADGTTKALNLAGGFGLSLVDVAAALSTLTQSGQTARNASDGLSAAMSGFVKPTTGAMTMVQALSRETGVNLVADFSAAGLKSRGLANAIDDVHLAIAKMGGETAVQRQTMIDYADQLTATGNITDAQFTAKMTKMAASIHDPTASLLQLFPNIRAFREMMLLTGSQSDSFAKNLGTLSDVMSGKLDPTTKGFAAQQATLAAQMAKLQTNVQILAINLGTVLLPPLTALVSQVTPIVQQFADWAGKNQQLVIGVLAAGAAIGALTVAAIGLGAAVEVATGPIGLLAAAGAGLYLAWQHNLGGIQGIVANMWNQVKPVLTEMQAAFAAGGVSGLAGKIQSSLAGIDWAGLGQTIARNVAQWGHALVGWVQPQIPGIVAALGDLANRVITYIRAAAPVIEGQMLAWGQAVWSWIQQATPHVVAQLQTWGAALISWVQPQIGPLVATLGGLLSRLGSWIVGDALPVVVAHLQQWGNAFIAWIAPKIGPMISAAGDLLGRLGAWMRGTALPAIGQHLQAWGQAFVAWIAPHINPMLTAAGNLLGQFGNWIGSTALPAISAKLVQWGNAFVAWIVPATLRFLNDWPGHLNKFLDVVEAAVPKIAAKLVEWGSAFVNWIQANNVIPKLATAFVAVNLAIIDFIGTTVGTIAIRLLKWANAFADWVVPSIKLLGPSLNLFWDALKTWVDNTAKDMGTKMLQFGKDTVQGFIDGLKAKAGDLKNAAEGIPNAVKNAVAGILHIGSPSKVMHQYGEWTVQGYADGIVARAYVAYQAITTVAQVSINTWGQTLAAGAPTIIQAVRDVWLQAWKPETLIGDMQAAWDSASVAGLMQGVITKGLGGQSWGGTFQGSTWGDALVKAGAQAVSTATPSIQSAHAGLARAAVAALAGGITSGAGAIAQATTAAMSQAAQAARASLAEFTAVSAEAAQRLKNLAATGNTSGVVAGQQAQVVGPSHPAAFGNMAGNTSVTAKIVADMVAGVSAASQLSASLTAMGINERQQITSIAQLRLIYGQVHLKLQEQIAAAQKAGYLDQVATLKAQDAQLNDNYQNDLLKLQALSQAQAAAHQQAAAVGKLTAAEQAAAQAASQRTYTNDVVGQQRLIADVTRQAAAQHKADLAAIAAATAAHNTTLAAQLKAEDAARVASFQSQLTQLRTVLTAMTQGHALTMAQIAEEAAARRAALAGQQVAGGTTSGNLGNTGLTVGSLTGAVAAATVSPLQQAIADATKVAPKAMHDYGVLMANLLAAGLAQGLGEQGAITYALSTLSKGMQGQISQDWQMHSPSKVAESYGRNIVAGLVGGIRASHADARAVLGGLTLGGGGGGAVAGGNVQVTVHVNGDAVTVSGVDHHGLGKAMGDVAKAFLAAARTTAPGASPLAPGGARTVPI